MGNFKTKIIRILGTIKKDRDKRINKIPYNPSLQDIKIAHLKRIL